MKRKIHKILGVTLTLVMVLTLAVAFSAPVMAAEEEWDLFDVPAVAGDGDWFMDDDIVGFGAFAKATDGTLYLYMDSAAAPIIDDLYISDDEGRTWAATDYKADLFPGAAVVTDAIVDMAISSEDADVLYVATATNVYKTEDAGDSWSDLGAPGGAAITCLDVGYADEEPHVYVGTTDSGAGFGEVYYYYDAPFASVWKDLDVCAPDGGLAVAGNYDVFGIACSPDFDSDTLVVAVITDGTKSFVTANVGAGIGDIGWDDLELLDDTPAAYAITGATDPVFVEDFEIDDAYELFVGVSGPAHADARGGVYRITGMTDADDFLLADIDDHIVSLDVVGDLAATSLLAGTNGTAAAVGPGSIWYSTDDGDSWDETVKTPTGVGATQNLVIVDDDFADSGIAWCASTAVTKEGGVHLTTDFGATWNGISMIDTNMATAVNDIAFSPDYGTGDAPMFMVTESNVAGADDSVWKYDGTNWERVWFDAANQLNMVEVSPEYANDTAVFIAAGAAPRILYSHDGGAEFTAMIRQPGDAITSWAVIDDETVITGAADGVTYMTTRYGRRAWDEPTMPTAAGLITDLVVLSDTILAGDDESQVFISFDSGDEFEEVSASDIAGFATLANDTYVAFDTRYADNNFIYAASGNVVARCEIDESEDMGDLEFDDIGDTLPTDFNNASAIVVSDDGKQAGEDVATLYVASSDEATDDVGAVHRCLNPEDGTADVIFEQILAGLNGQTFFNLELTAGNILYAIDTAPAIDTAVPDVIYTYEDTLAAQVVLTSPKVKAGLDSETRVAFSWEDLNADTVNIYQIYVNEEDDFPSATDETVGTVSANSNLHDDNELTWRHAEAGTEYFWKVRVAEGGPVLSRWSDVRSFTTKVGAVAAPVGVTPGSGADDVILQPAFSWKAVTGASSYEIEVADNPGFSPLVAEATSAINAWASDVELDYSTTYYWKVRGISASGAPAGDEVIAVFTTMAKPAAAPAPVTVTEVPAPDVTVTVPVTEITPAWIWAIIAIGAVLCIAVIVLIVRTRRVV